ncbi:MAG: phosphate-starvation-inducible PsiE family protein [Desulfosoma sp.]
MLSRIIQRFEGIALQVLMVMMAVVLTATIVDLAWLLWVDFSSPPYFLLSVDELLELFSQFLLVLIGLELLETVIKTYATPQQPHFEVVLNVAIIAVARKIIILDIKKETPLSIIGLAAITLGLAIAYYLMKRGQQEALPRKTLHDGR